MAPIKPINMLLRLKKLGMVGITNIHIFVQDKLSYGKKKWIACQDGAPRHFIAQVSFCTLILFEKVCVKQ